MKHLETLNIKKSYNDKVVIDEISIHLNKGELVSLLGISGSGKTTLFNIISGIEKPDSGKVLLSGEDITNKPGRISYMLQKDLLLPYYTIIDNVSLPLIIKGKLSKKEARNIAKKHFPTFGIDTAENKYPFELSGGMRQRAALLRTYLAFNEVALLDEPFSALDAITKSAIHTWYLDIMEKIDLSTLFVTHDIDEAILLSDRIYILAGSPGKIVDEIKIDAKRNERKDFLVSEKFIEYKKQIVRSLNK